MSETLSRRAVLTGAVRGTLPEEETFDVVVVGSGAAGLAAVPGTPQQSEAGIGDNPELMFNDLIKVTEFPAGSPGLEPREECGLSKLF